MSDCLYLVGRRRNLLSLENRVALSNQSFDSVSCPVGTVHGVLDERETLRRRIGCYGLLLIVASGGRAAYQIRRRLQHTFTTVI